MASPDELPRTVVSFFRSHRIPPSRVCAGFSGGRDSVVLLHLLSRCKTELQIELSAVHVNHQLSPNADRWAAFCAELCAALAIPLTIERVVVPRDSGKGIEAAARKARYQIYDQADADVIALAHHRDDQAETVLLQALRGAGLKGIGGMPATKQRREKMIVRPLLSIDAGRIAQYAAEQRLAWIEDESNADIRYFRNHLRHEILPRLAVHAPAYRDSLTRLAQHAAAAQRLLDELAGIDAPSAIECGQLSLAGLLDLSDERAKNLLRYYFSRGGIAVPNASQLDEMLRQLRSHTPDRDTEIVWADRVLRCHRGLIHVGIVTDRKADAWRMLWRGEAELTLPQGSGVLRLEPRAGEGIARYNLERNPVTVRSRIGGERMRLAPSRPRRTLKNLLQEAGVPPWQRGRLPLLFCGEELVWAPRIGIAAGFAAAADDDGMVLSWQP